jgi:hypothetical protein
MLSLFEATGASNHVAPHAKASKSVKAQRVEWRKIREDGMPMGANFSWQTSKNISQRSKK